MRVGHSFPTPYLCSMIRHNGFPSFILALLLLVTSVGIPFLEAGCTMTNQQQMSCCSGNATCHKPSSSKEEMPCCAEQDVHWEHLQTQAVSAPTFAFIALVAEPLAPITFGSVAKENKPSTQNKAPPRCLEPELSKLQRYCI